MLRKSPRTFAPETELNILLTLHNEERDGRVRNRGKVRLLRSTGRAASTELAERSLINRAATIGSVYKFTITPEAESAYFDDLGTGDLNVSNSDEGG